MMIRSMSAIRARVAELEALVDQREVRDDRRLGGQGYGGPTVGARRPEGGSLHAAAGIGARPVDRFPPRPVDGRDSHPSARPTLRGGALPQPRPATSHKPPP